MSVHVPLRFKVFTHPQRSNSKETKTDIPFTPQILSLSPVAQPTCNDLLCGAGGAVAGLIFGHHCHIVGQFFLLVKIPMLISPVIANFNKVIYTTKYHIASF